MMNVCGVLVHARPDKVKSVEALLTEIPGVETHGEADNARLVVTIEDTETMSAMDAMSAVNRTDGVVATALVYHEMEPDLDARSSATEEKPC
ncbi:MAG: chaperone NapD [Cohaesibacter sp.]|nr:chaperone NapD [Cohaesibacter sp.]MCV6600016.1 chaperone NapD [Cohaesibacter sp.]